MQKQSKKFSPSHFGNWKSCEVLSDLLSREDKIDWRISVKLSNLIKHFQKICNDIYAKNIYCREAVINAVYREFLDKLENFFATNNINDADIKHYTINVVKGVKTGLLRCAYLNAHPKYLSNIKNPLKIKEYAEVSAK